MNTARGQLCRQDPRHTGRLHTEICKFPLTSLPGKKCRDQSVWSEAQETWQLRMDGKELKQRSELDGKKQRGKIALSWKVVNIKVSCWVSQRQEWTFPAGMYLLSNGHLYSLLHLHASLLKHVGLHGCVAVGTANWVLSGLWHRAGEENVFVVFDTSLWQNFLCCVRC